jgi:hypothetical protein
VQEALIGFERQHVVSIGLVNLFGHGLLAAHRVHCHHTAGQFQGAQQRGQRRDLIAVVGDFQLPQHQTVTRRPDIDQVDRPVPARPTSPQGLAIQRHQFTGDELAQALRPRHETVHELRWVNEPEHAVEGVVGRRRGWRRN